MLRIANEELVSDGVILRMDILKICCSNPQCGDGVPAEGESRSRQRGEHADFDRLWGSRSNFSDKSYCYQK
jgi:hypothetical protein